MPNNPLAQKCTWPLTGPALTRLIEHCSRGYTLRRLRELMEEDGYDLRHVMDPQIIVFMRETGKVSIQEARQLNEEYFQHEIGLSDRLERIRRLAETAEKIEAMVDLDPRWTSEYRRLLGDIHLEMEPFGITIRPGDGWADLMTQVINAVADRSDDSDLASDLDESDLGTAKAIAFTPRGEVIS